MLCRGVRRAVIQAVRRVQTSPAAASQLSRSSGGTARAFSGQSGGRDGGGEWKRSYRRPILGFAAVTGIGAALKFRESEDREAAKVKLGMRDQSANRPPQERYVHPFTNKPTLWRWGFILFRGIRLAVIFAPLIATSVVVFLLPVPERWREELPNYLVLKLEEAGCSFQKMGQWLSMRPDVCPQDFITALGKLRDEAPSHSWEGTRDAVVESFGGRQLDEVFSEFDREPVASGSVAQVHRARFRDDAQEAGEFAGKEVAVKVLHPLVMESTFVDISLIFGLLNTAGRLLNMGMPFDQASFYHAMSRQLDLNWEAYNLRQFQENFGDDTGILFPLVAHSTDRVLVESWFDGKSISHIFATGGGESAWGHSEKRVGGEDDQISEERRRRIAKKVFDLTIKMFLRDNYIHGDMHGGNLMIPNDPNDDRIIVLDAGLTTALEADWAGPFGYLLHALSTNDAGKVADKLVMFNINEKASASLNKDAVKEEISEIMEGAYSVAGKKGAEPVNMGVMIGMILSALQKHQINLRGDVALTIITMSISEGLIRQLDPDFDCVTASLPYFVRYRSWQKASLSQGSQWEEDGGEVGAANSGLPEGGSRGLAVTSRRPLAIEAA